MAKLCPLKNSQYGSSKDCNEICFKIRVQKDKQQNISAVKYYK